jgi:phage tail-like protein
MAKHLRPYTGGQFALELEDGGGNSVPVGFLTAIDGGHFKSDEVKSMVGYDNYLVTKFPGKPKYDDITLTLGMATSPGFWNWIKASLNNKPERRSGAIVVYDFKKRERQRRTFTNALLSEIGFPALDASSKASANMTIKISPESLTWDEPSNEKAGPFGGQNEVPKQKMWLASNFAFELEKFKGDKRLRHAKIEAFTIKQAVVSNPIGMFLETPKEPSRLEMPGIQVTFSQSNADPWVDWYNKAVVKGNFPDQLTTGSITYYASDGEKTELMTVHLDGVGLTSLEFDKLEAHRDGIARVKASLYIDSLKLDMGDGTVDSD